MLKLFMLLTAHKLRCLTAILPFLLINGGQGQLLPPIGPLDLDPKIYPADPTQYPNRAYPDIQVEGELVDWKSYRVEFFPNPLESSQLKPEQKLIAVTGVNGTKFQCIVPEPKHAKPTAQLPSSTTELIAEAMYLIRHLQSSCIRLNNGYWTFEYCHLKYLRQFHVKELTKPITPDGLDVKAKITELISGEGGVSQLLTQIFFDVAGEDTSSTEHLLGRYVPGSSNERIEDGYLTMDLIDGERCTEEGFVGKERTTKVRFKCVKGYIGDKIVSVSELSTCQYFMVVSCPRLCMQEEEEEDESELLGLKSVSCYPLTREDAMNTTVDKDEYVKERQESEPWISNSLKVAYVDQLRMILKAESETYPLIRKLMLEFMEAEDIAIHEMDIEELPPKLINKWFEVLDVKTETLTEQQSHSSLPSTKVDSAHAVKGSTNQESNLLADPKLSMSDTKGVDRPKLTTTSSTPRTEAGNPLAGDEEKDSADEKYEL